MTAPTTTTTTAALYDVFLAKFMQTFDSANADTHGMFLLNDYQLLTVAGADAQKFLQGQVTCDVTTVAAGEASRGAHCTPKGRAIASFLMASTAADSFTMMLPSDNAANLRASLSKYIVFSKASISVNDSHIALGLNGKHAESFIQQHLSDLADSTVIPVDTQRFIVWLTPSSLESLWAVLTDTFTAFRDGWQTLNIAQGWCDITAASTDAFIPQMFGLGENHGISYKKGCYTGQEIVARLHFLGQQKRQLATFDAPDAEAIAVMDSITTADGKTVGSVTTVAGNIGLAVINTAALEQSALQLNEHSVLLTALSAAIEE